VSGSAFCRYQNCVQGSMMWQLHVTFRERGGLHHAHTLATLIIVMKQAKQKLDHRGTRGLGAAAEKA
jgi:hypothetical protein